ncbi:MAG: hypothetical protein Tsb0021_10490 [Chlamydiales bacterium]
MNHKMQIGKSKVYWNIFLAALALILSWYLYNAISSISFYFSLNTPTLARELQWNSKEKSSDEYFPIGHYIFEVDDKHYSGSTLFDKERYWNQESLKKELQNKQKKEWIVWYDAANPKISSLKKSFPFKEIFYSAILFAILIYFIGLRQYILTRKK